MVKLQLELATTFGRDAFNPNWGIGFNFDPELFPNNFSRVPMMLLLSKPIHNNAYRGVRRQFWSREAVGKLSVNGGLL
ncbi:hypothetical protein [Marinobacter adhaerens]|uniref:hypothetical protein n=1 Tax=Marinobacter adhaerens TaxID=1033846 RepID=UPI001C56A4B1|nr:hypothetical protein [Marinobacter adhaerens]MBW3225267.1 hypothetical protein [Marinobacter adhaerens]MCR9189781.1 hypothetical protein [Alteromonadaceae bacterium]